MKATASTGGKPVAVPVTEAACDRGVDTTHDREVTGFVEDLESAPGQAGVAVANLSPRNPASVHRVLRPTFLAAFAPSPFLRAFRTRCGW